AYGIGGLAVFVAVIFVSLLSVAARRGQRVAVAVGACGVLAVSAAVAASGRLARFDALPPPMLLMIASVFVMGFGVGLSSVARRAADTLPLAALVGLQAFRLPLELVMHRAASLGIMPPQLSYSGYNFDIVTGLGACVLAGLMLFGVTVPRWTLWAWNIWGWWCLAAIAVIAVTTSPMVRLFGDDPRNLNTWVLYFPYVWLPVVLVTVAIAGHVMVTRALRRR
ncbi:MAG TPA: hypothetical protein VIY56_09740, partial [Vicinamibacterales bacterium]